MVDLLEDAIRKARTLPHDVQEEIAHVMLAYIGDDPAIIQLTPEEEAELEAADAEIARGEFASDDEVAAVFDKYRL